MYTFPILSTFVSLYILFLLIRAHSYHAAIFEIVRIVCFVVCAQLLFGRNAAAASRLGCDLPNQGRSRVLLAFASVNLLADLTLFLVLTGGA